MRCRNSGYPCEWFSIERESWIAHCLEFDLLGDGETRKDALENLSEAIALQISASIENKNPSNLFSPAEGKFFEMFAAGKEIANGQLQVQVQQLRETSPIVDGVEAREFEGTIPELALC